MQKRQEAFLSALIRDPSLALHVKGFSWTLLLLDSNIRTHLGPDPFDIGKVVALDPGSPFLEIWNVFASLTSVRALDLGWLSTHLAMPLIHGIPPTLFPAATSIRLVGVMPYVLAASILFTNPWDLLHLDLDNLQQSGIIPSTHMNEEPGKKGELYKINVENATPWNVFDFARRRDHYDRHRNSLSAPDDPAIDIAPEWVRRTEGSPARSILPHRQTRQPWNKLRTRTIMFFRDDGEYFNAPGPMQNLLGALAGKCTSLKSLCLRKAGARDQFDFDPASTHKERDVYAEWALFLASVQPTLESLALEQGERLLPRKDGAQPAVRPMDQLFGDMLFPVLAATAEEAGQRWPRLKKVVVGGVQQWRQGGGPGTGNMVLVDGERELPGTFGNEVEVVVSRRAREADHLGVGYGNPWR